MLTSIADQIQAYPALVSTLTILLVSSFILPRFYHLKGQLGKIPLLRAEESSAKRRENFVTQAKNMYTEGYQKFTDSIFQLTTTDMTHVIVPPKYLNELRNLPDNVLDVYAAMEDSMQNKYTKTILVDHTLIHSIRADLTPNLARVNHSLIREVAQSIQEELPECKDWTGVVINEKLLRIVAKVSGALFIGSELCRNEDYIEASIKYAIEAFAAARRLKTMRPWARPFVAPFIHEMKEIKQRRIQARKFLEPVIAARQEAAEKPGYEKPDDMLQWLMDRFEKAGVVDVNHLAICQLGLSMAAIHTTTTSVTNIMYNLAVMPKYVEPLREEIVSVRDQYDGVLTMKALQNMKKLDSFVMESMRVSPLGFASFLRKVKKGFTLSNGQYIPAGVLVEVSMAGVHEDPSIYANHDQFDGFRSYRLRDGNSSAEANRHQLVGTSPQHLTFGYGRHACPGRFFAANEIKLILSEFLLQYDFKNADGTDTRYKNFEVGVMSVPDPSKELLFKKRAEAETIWH